MKELVFYGVHGVLALSMGVYWAISPKIPQLAVVDMNVLIAEGSQGLARAGKTSSQDIQEWGSKLKEKLHAFGRDRHLTLLAKGAVIGDSLPDMTEDVLGFIESGDLSQ